MENEMTTFQKSVLWMLGILIVLVLYCAVNISHIYSAVDNNSSSLDNVSSTLDNVNDASGNNNTDINYICGSLHIDGCK